MRVVLGLGSNLGDRLATLRRAADLVASELGIEVLARSSVVESPPAGGLDQPDYLNAALLLETELEPRALLARTLAIEEALGRVRRERWGSRTIDIDFLWRDGPPFDDAALRVPHAHLHERPFALQPLLELCPDARDERGDRLVERDAARPPLPVVARL